MCHVVDIERYHQTHTVGLPSDLIIPSLPCLDYHARSTMHYSNDVMFVVVVSSCNSSLVNDPGYVIPDSAISASGMYHSTVCHKVHARNISNPDHEAWCSGEVIG